MFENYVFQWYFDIKFNFNYFRFNGNLTLENVIFKHHINLWKFYAYSEKLINNFHNKKKIRLPGNWLQKFLFQ